MTLAAALVLLLAPSALLVAQAPPAATEPPPDIVQQTVVVTATRSPMRISETNGATLVVSRDDLDRAAAPTLDDTLRQIPGFALFRRSGSRTANPTAQGVSLRGVGASGASRALVLDDGVPLNDPFGGWVYWSRVPREAIAQVEVVRGGGSDLYGSSSLGGVIQLIRRDAQEELFTIAASTGSMKTREVSLFGALTRDAWSAVLGASALGTDGYVPVQASQRGAVDARADVMHRTAELTLQRVVGEHRLFVRAASFAEERSNGTRLQVNDTTSTVWSGGADLRLNNSSASFRGWLGDQDYHQTFSSIGAGRNTEQVTRDQDVDASFAGITSQWVHAPGRHTIVAGADFRTVEAVNDELVAATGVHQVASGTQRSGGFFASALLDLGDRWSASVGARWDEWRNVDARIGGNVLRDRRSSAFSPRLTFAYALTGDDDLFGSAYTAFRAPTLNELYRSFRVGNVLTEANPELEAEQLSGVELGARHRFGNAASLRLNLFNLWITDPIANVTTATTPQLVTRQRRNLGRTRTLGAEVDYEQRLRGGAVYVLSYLFSDAQVASFAADRQLEGNRLPQTPRHQLTSSIRGDWRAYDYSLDARWSGDQFEDDRNALKLDQLTTFDVYFARRLMARAQLFVAAENLFDERYEVGRAGVTTLGPPRSTRVGVRWRR